MHLVPVGEGATGPGRRYGERCIEREPNAARRRMKRVPRGHPRPRAVAVVHTPHVHIQARVTVGTYRRRGLALTPIVPALISPLDRTGQPAWGAVARRRGGTGRDTHRGRAASE